VWGLLRWHPLVETTSTLLDIQMSEDTHLIVRHAHANKKTPTNVCDKRVAQTTRNVCDKRVAQNPPPPPRPARPPFPLLLLCHFKCRAWLAVLAVLVSLRVKPSFRDPPCADTTRHAFGQLKKEASVPGASRVLLSRNLLPRGGASLQKAHRYVEVAQALARLFCCTQAAANQHPPHGCALTNGRVLKQEAPVGVYGL
jgi:hypothetical protein